jgi:hypothetical protein
LDEAVAAAEKSDVAIVVVGTWSRDQQELWQGLNATYELPTPEKSLLCKKSAKSQKGQANTST